MTSTIDLILLGMIQEEASSAYDLQKKIKQRNISCWVQVSKTSIYKRVQILESDGCVKSTTTSQGNMPLKTVYSITDEGKKTLLAGMRKTSKEALRFFIDFNAVLINLAHFNEDVQKEMLINIQNSITDFYDGVHNNTPSKAQIPLWGDAIIQQQLMLSETMKTWIEQITIK